MSKQVISDFISQKPYFKIDTNLDADKHMLEFISYVGVKAQISSLNKLSEIGNSINNLNAKIDLLKGSIEVLAKK